ncbi:putative PMT4-dolichyl-phosphate-mannose--protein O-mannosyltransferase [Testicularia cyperi]|uniref:Dolichyl-phosphate-mannose--protein mannosyltransferase n=1 Tax=Testicularia cyperi TaxID=1882483 RepID=A0A317XZ60_9BASI|nr:putative PMT4-dolichyl-phosphate-mannose--protein O-mannosyltransferase [Testicularia cyperi]
MVTYSNASYCTVAAVWHKFVSLVLCLLLVSGDWGEHGAMDATRAQSARPRKPVASGLSTASEQEALLPSQSQSRYDSSYADGDGDESKYRAHAVPLSPKVHSHKADTIIAVALFLLAISLRFYRIGFPDQVVFDEVHFGKFAAYYIRREFHFDVHPPLAKLINAAAGYFAGFDGHFEFDQIGDKYLENNVPYMRMRAVPAIIGSLQVPLLYAIMRESGYAPVIGAFSAALLLFDNAHVAQDRLILLDAPLILFMMLSLYCYIKFYKLRYNEFTTGWWFWLTATGVNLAMTMSCKMVGLFTFMTIGAAVLFDLWKLLDIRRGLEIEHVAKHFIARSISLIVIPFCVYLFWFWVHFAILIRSGPGDAFMSSQFQQTLEGNPMLSTAREIQYYDTITMQHKNTKAYLHSHVQRYPLKYDDGRISSQGQQVTGYPHNDTNNIWQIIPTKPIPDNDPEERIVVHKDHIRLLHVNTNSYLLTHDVASSLMATNEEFTTVPANDTSRYDDTIFEFQLDDPEGANNKDWKSKASFFRLIHVPTRVCMWTHSDPLPDWAFNQQEVNGNKNAMDKTCLWVVDDLHPSPQSPDYEERLEPLPPREVIKLNFFKKWIELQLQMLHQNAGLTQSHPYATGPINWPFLLQGISFWTQDKGQHQIYMIGNLVSWWGSILSISVFIGVVGADMLARRRGVYPIPSAVRNRLYNSTGFFVVAWACHYAPFFLMNRQLFIHHYLPAHVCACMVAGGVLNFVVSETIQYPISVPGPLLRPRDLRPRMDNLIPAPARAVMAVFLILLVACFWWLSPLTYGTPGLTTDQVHARRLLSSWTLHFAK